MASKDNSSAGVGFFGLLTIVFIVLKLTNVIDWSWWWVFSPLLAPVVIDVLFFIILRILWFFFTKDKY